MPLMVQNNGASTTLFALPGGRQPIIWAPSGSPNGEDVQRVPDDLAKDIEFLRALDHGVLTVVDGDDPDVLVSLQRSSSQYAERQARAREASEALLDRRQDRDIVGEACIGPDSRGNDGKCGNQVLMRASERNETPPLCNIHKGLAPQFYLTQEGSKGEGASETRAGEITRTWKRVTMTAPARGQ